VGLGRLQIVLSEGGGERGERGQFAR
jgi:hypothetical protein